MAKHPGHINQWSILYGNVGFSSYYSQVKTERFIPFSISVFLHLITSWGELPSFQIIQMQIPIESRRQWRILPAPSSCCIFHTEACWKRLTQRRCLGFTSAASAAAMENKCCHFCDQAFWLSLSQYIHFQKSNTLEQVNGLEGSVV